jgi:exosortase/archaeosortase family protein
MISLRLIRIQSIALYEIIITLWIAIILLTGFTRDWIFLALTVVFIYVLAYLLSYRAYQLVFPPITCIFILFYVFRIDEMIMHSVLVDYLISLTTKSLSFMIKNGSIVVMFISIACFWYFRSLWCNYLGNKSKKGFYVISLIFLIAVICFDFLSKSNVTMIDPSTFEFHGTLNITRISIIDSCSGIYGLLIFFASFMIFINFTKLNRELDNSHIFVLGTLGAIGVFLVNLIRIIILIILNLVFSLDLMQETHLYLGGILIILYLSFFWSLIWSELPVQTQADF